MMYVKTDFSNLGKILESLIEFPKTNTTVTKPFDFFKPDETTASKKTCKNKCYEEDIDGILKTVLDGMDKTHKIVEDKKSKAIHFALPGHSKEDISVKIEANNLILKSLREESLFVKKGYEKRIELSNDLDLDNYDAKLANGIFSIIFPKINKTKEIVID